MQVHQKVYDLIFIETEDDLKFVKSIDPYAQHLQIGKWWQNKKNKTNSLEQNNIYVVKPLDTFASVSKKLGISQEKLKTVAKTKHLFIGQKINL